MREPVSLGIPQWLIIVTVSGIVALAACGGDITTETAQPVSSISTSIAVVPTSTVPANLTPKPLTPKPLAPNPPTPKPATATESQPTPRPTPTAVPTSRPTSTAALTPVPMPTQAPTLAPTPTSPPQTPSPTPNVPIQPPLSLGLDPFYTKYVGADGIPVIGSSKVRDEALGPAREIIVNMLSARPDIREAMIANKARVGIMAVTEVTTDIPEQSDLAPLFDTRARGLGGTIFRPITTVGEESLLCLSSDVYRGESILVRELSHGVFNLGLPFVSDGKQITAALLASFDQVMSLELWSNTYAATNLDEYQAESVQSWFNSNIESVPSNGIHNQVDTRPELKEYDPALAQVLSMLYPDGEWEPPCS